MRIPASTGPRGRAAAGNHPSDRGIDPESVSPRPGDAEALVQHRQIRNPFRHLSPEQTPRIQGSRNGQRQRDLVVRAPGGVCHADDITLFLVLQINDISQSDAQVRANHARTEIARRDLELAGVTVPKRKLAQQPLRLKSGGGYLQLVGRRELRTGVDNGKAVVPDLLSLGGCNQVMTELVTGNAADDAQSEFAPLRARIVEGPAFARSVHGRQSSREQHYCHPEISDQNYL